MNLALNALSILNRSGTGAYARALVDYLSRTAIEGVTVHVFLPALPCPTLLYDPASLRFPEGVIPHFIKVGGPGGRIRRVLYESFSFPAELRKLGIDLLHGPTGIVPGRTACDTAVTVHDVAFRVHPKDFSFRHRLFLERAIPRSARAARKVLTDSHFSKTEIHKHLGVPLEKIEVIPLGVEERFFQPVSSSALESLRGQFQLPRDFALYVGTIEPRKNLNTLIQAIPLIAKECPDFSLVLAGRRGWKTRGLLEAISGLSDPTRVRLIDFVPAADLPTLFAAGRVFVYPSRYEGFGLPPLEAMACGRPVFVTDGSSLPEVVGEAGILVDTTGRQAIADAMTALWQDANTRERLGNEARERAMGFSWDLCAKRTFEVLKGIFVS